MSDERKFLIKGMVLYALFALVLFIPFWIYVCLDEYYLTGRFSWAAFLLVMFICIGGGSFLLKYAVYNGWLNFLKRK